MKGLGMVASAKVQTNRRIRLTANSYPQGQGEGSDMGKPGLLVLVSILSYLLLTQHIGSLSWTSQTVLLILGIVASLVTNIVEYIRSEGDYRTRFMMANVVVWFVWLASFVITWQHWWKMTLYVLAGVVILLLLIILACKLETIVRFVKCLWNFCFVKPLKFAYTILVGRLASRSKEISDLRSAVAAAKEQLAKRDAEEAARRLKLVEKLVYVTALVKTAPKHNKLGRARRELEDVLKSLVGDEKQVKAMLLDAIEDESCRLQN